MAEYREPAAYQKERAWEYEPFKAEDVSFDGELYVVEMGKDKAVVSEKELDIWLFGLGPADIF